MALKLMILSRKAANSLSSFGGAKAMRGAGRQVAVGIAADDLHFVFTVFFAQRYQRLNALMRLPAQGGQIAEAPDQIDFATAF